MGGWDDRGLGRGGAMSQSDGQDKSLEATPEKLKKARKQGNVACLPGSERRLEGNSNFLSPISLR